MITLSLTQGRAGFPPVRPWARRRPASRARRRSPPGGTRRPRAG